MVLLAVLMGGAIGYERELKGRDAGLRTHMLVSLGAAAITMVQLQATNHVVEFSLSNPSTSEVLSTDIMRLTAQIVSGIGFLGAGTIIVSKKSVTGLTTAASIWAVASLGIAIGIGEYFLALSATLIILIVLRVVKSILKIEQTKQIEIEYVNRDKTSNYLLKYFDKHNITIVSNDYSINYIDDNTTHCHDIYTLHIPNNYDIKELIDNLGLRKEILKINTIKSSIEI